MIRDIFRNMSPRMGLFFTLVFVVIGFLLSISLGIVVSGFYSGVWDAQYLTSSNIDTHQGQTIIRILQISQTIGLFILPSLVMAFLVSEKPWMFLGFKSVTSRLVFLSVILMIVALPGINLMASLNAMIDMPQWMIDFEHTAERIIRALLQTESIGVVMLNIFMVAVLPAIGEELLFRGVIQPYLCKIFRSTFIGVLFTAIFFSAFHFQFQGFIPRMLLGLIFGYLYIWTKSIWVPIAVHFVNNGLAVVVFYFISKGDIPALVEKVGEVGHLWSLGALSLAATAALTWMIYRERVSSE